MQISFTKRKLHLVYIALGVVSLLLAGVTHVARAEEVNDPAPVMQGRAEAIGEQVKERMAGLKEEQQNRFINLVRNAYGRMDAAIDRLSGIALRIETRIAALEAQGVDVSPARTPLAEAKAKLVDAKSKLKEAKTAAEDALVSDTPRERFPAARTQFVEVRQQIRDAFILIRQSLAELRDAVMEAELNKGTMGSRGAEMGSTSTTTTPQ